jgi:ribonuclease VapC
MFLDASIIVAIIAEEAGYEAFKPRLFESDGPIYVSPIVHFEAVQAIARNASAPLKPTAEQLTNAGKTVDRLLAALDARNVDLTEEIGKLAVVASATYGKAVSHPADLNMGDCFAYACAKTLNVPLLYKGNDFAKTDLA